MLKKTQITNYLLQYSQFHFVSFTIYAKLCIFIKTPFDISLLPFFRSPIIHCGVFPFGKQYKLQSAMQSKHVRTFLADCLQFFFAFYSNSVCYYFVSNDPTRWVFVYFIDIVTDRKLFGASLSFSLVAFFTFIACSCIFSRFSFTVHRALRPAVFFSHFNREKKTLFSKHH